jgi:hypothetical protein
MTPTIPVPTLVLHFTHLDHLPSIVRGGLLADTQAQASGQLTVEVGNHGIKEARRRRAVTVAPYGVVADYVPFYFAPRSPMMFAIDRGNVPTYQGGCKDLIYLVSTVQRLGEEDFPIVLTDRNASLAVTTFSADVAKLSELVDWPLMKERYWANTLDDPDRMERRMAECLVHRTVPWSAIVEIGVFDRTRADRVTDTLHRLGARTRVVVRRNWYF